MAENIKKLTMRNCCIDEDGQTDEPIIKKLNEVIDFINSIDVSPVRHGRWLCVDTDTERFFLCNRCKKKECWESNYCPNCGCLMDGGDDE